MKICFSFNEMNVKQINIEKMKICFSFNEMNVKQMIVYQINIEHINL